MDLDQALHLERDGDGFVVHYAIADVAAFVDAGRPGRPRGAPPRRDAVRRGLEDPAAPHVALRGCGSLLPDQVRPALLWTIRLDAKGDGTEVDVERARVQLARQAVVRRGAGRRSTPAPPTRCSAARGGRHAPHRARGRPWRRLAADAGAGDRRSTTTAGGWSSASLHPVEGWNAQISLLTGIVAAAIDARRQGRPPADPARRPTRTRRRAAAAHRQGAARSTGPRTQDYPAFDPLARPVQAEPRGDGGGLHVTAARRRLRGFDGEVPSSTSTPRSPPTYAHVTAPLRRLVDRYALEICVAICAGNAVAGLGARASSTCPDHAASPDAGPTPTSTR